MRKFAMLAGPLALAMASAAPSWASGLPNNTAYVEPTTGADSGSCGAATSPCATLNQALANVSSGGNIYVLSGGTFGPIYLTAAVAIHGPPDDSLNIIWSNAAPGCVGAAAGTCAATSNYAVDIEATSSDVFKFRYIIFNNGAGTNGAMKIGNAAGVKMDEVALRGGTGSAPQLLLAEPNTGTQFQLLIQGGNIGFSSGGGVLVEPQGSTSAAVLVTHAVVQNLTYGFKFTAATTSAAVGVEASINDSELLNFASGAVAIIGTGSSQARLAVTRSNLLNSAQQAVQVNGANALANLYLDSIFGNAAGVNVLSGGQAITLGNNDFGNGNNCTSSSVPTACSSVLTSQSPQ